MPQWIQPPRTLLAALKRIRSEARNASGQSDITDFTVESVNGDSTYNVKNADQVGQRIPATGVQPSIRVGQSVPVARIDGKPVVIFSHSARRAKFHPTPVLGATGIVEELFIATDPRTKKLDVFFRNFEQITALKMADFLPGDPTQVFWGVNADIFGVRTGDDYYHVFRLDRRPTKLLQSAAKVKEKLYSAKLSNRTVTLSQITLKMHRDSVEPVFQTTWDFVGDVSPVTAIIGAKMSVNVNQADVQRTATIKLTGATQLSVETTGALEGSLPTAKLGGVIIDENLNLLYSVILTFTDFKIKQGDASGVTGQRKKIGMGVIENLTFFEIYAKWPHIIDDFPVQDFRGFDGNPGGSVSTHITEKHTVLINALNGAIVFSTMDPAPTLEIHEDAGGQTPYFAAEYLTFFAPTNSHHAYVPDGHIGYSSTYGPIIGSQNYGELGRYGIIRSDRSLFAAQPFNPDGVPRTSLILSDTGEKRKYETERTDGFLALNGQGSIFPAGDKCVEAIYTNPVAVIEDRYRVDVVATPFYAADFKVYQFVGVLRVPNPNSGFPSDPLQTGAFVVVGFNSVTALDYTTVASQDMPEFLAGSKTRVLWKLGADWYMTNFVAPIETKKIGSNIDDVVKALTLLSPDFLYSTNPPQEFFVKGWTKDAITLSQSDKKFPPKDAALADVGFLRSLSKGQSAPYPGGSFHVIEDTSTGVKFNGGT